MTWMNHEASFRRIAMEVVMIVYIDGVWYYVLVDGSLVEILD